MTSRKTITKLFIFITLILITKQFCGAYPALTKSEPFNREKGVHKEGKFDFPSKKKI